MNFNLGSANGKYYQRIAGVEGVHDGQIMVRLNKKRFIIIDYSIVPNQNDVLSSANNAPIIIPFGAGVTICTGKVSPGLENYDADSLSLVKCKKIGVPVVLYDSESNEVLSSRYVLSGLCFSCQKKKNKKDRAQDNIRIAKRKELKQQQQQRPFSFSAGAGATTTKCLVNNSTTNGHKNNEKKTPPRPSPAKSSVGVKKAQQSDDGSDDTQSSPFATLNLVKVNSKIRRSSSSSLSRYSSRHRRFSHTTTSNKNNTDEAGTPLRARVLSSSSSISVSLANTKCSTATTMPSSSSKPKPVAPSTMPTKESASVSVDTNKKELEVIDLLDSSSDEKDVEKDTDIARIRNGNSNHITNKRAVPNAAVVKNKKLTITKEQRIRNQTARSSPKRLNVQDFIDLFDSDSDTDSVHMYNKDRDGDNKIIATKNDGGSSNNETKRKKNRSSVKKKGKRSIKKQRLSGYDTYSEDDTDDDDDDDDYLDPSEKKRGKDTKKGGVNLEGNDEDDDVSVAVSSSDGDVEFPHDSKTGKPHSTYMTRPEFQLAEALVKKIYGQQEELRSVLCDGIPIEDCHYDCSKSKDENAPVITSLSFTIDDLRGRCNRDGWNLPDEIMEFGDTLEELSLTHCKKVPEDIAKSMKVLHTIRLYANTTESKTKRACQRKIGGGRNTATNNNNNAMIPKNIVNFYTVDVDVDDNNNDKNRDETPLPPPPPPPPKLILYGFKTIPRELENFGRHVSLIGGNVCPY